MEKFTLVDGEDYKPLDITITPRFTAINGLMASIKLLTSLLTLNPNYVQADREVLQKRRTG